jgi:hypothetical protein
MAAELGWGQTRCELELESYLATAEREYAVA